MRVLALETSCDETSAAVVQREGGVTTLAGLAILAPLLEDERLAAYQPLHAAHAELLQRAGRRAEAVAAYDSAIALTGNAAERAELRARRAAALAA